MDNVVLVKREPELWKDRSNKIEFERLDWRLKNLENDTPLWRVC